MINKVMLIGNLGADPEVRYSQSGDAVTTFRIATTEVWKKQDGSKEEQTEWHRIVAFKRLGEICGEYLAKGSRVYIEGRIQNRKWQDKDGNDRYISEIVAREMKMLSPRGAGGDLSAQTTNEPPTPEPPIGDDVPF
ncbi:MAG: single-stranded DNA-binding protein [Desulfobulbaceae bacterium]|nr:MAG: single-stranded DNA-binding protein [Desulfobulbaceae bacterium]